MPTIDRVGFEAARILELGSDATKGRICNGHVAEPPAGEAIDAFGGMAEAA
jgi:hypothetical protein